MQLTAPEISIMESFFVVVVIEDTTYLLIAANQPTCFLGDVKLVEHRSGVSFLYRIGNVLRIDEEFIFTVRGRLYIYIEFTVIFYKPLF